MIEILNHFESWEPEFHEGCVDVDVYSSSPSLGEYRVSLAGLWPASDECDVEFLHVEEDSYLPLRGKRSVKTVIELYKNVLKEAIKVADAVSVNYFVFDGCTDKQHSIYAALLNRYNVAFKYVAVEGKTRQAISVSVAELAARLK